ncbi:hypothetical protein EJ05DRAFT_541919 [Pseudovirgaria hyperparasitica]|uniref:Uncharacterized protein n=1 Tax=Pseudovirgaria hyperparasitica TaxID=470096 RepID=A0A6A6VUE5_9PEZI|nr:uncharacterized protein EJ05DRAFT_541919 [Pseudovirgaria hyperparasitica]KAF2753406.1 hypothetical protein EJ05DRAFT_541919 [Pseudovirgaria hyperparasitica]
MPFADFLSSVASTATKLNGWYKYGVVPLVNQLGDSLQQDLFVAKKKLLDFNFRRLPHSTWRYVKAHPFKTIFYIVGGVSTGIMIFQPALIFGPLLSLMGFTAVGPAAGSLAAAWQASLGTVAGGSLFAILQSAAMAGYGAVIVGGVLTTGAVSFVAIEAAKLIKAAINPNRNMAISEGQRGVDTLEPDEE